MVRNNPRLKLSRARRAASDGGDEREARRSKTRTRVRATGRERGSSAAKKERTEHDLNSVEWGPSQISIFLLSRRSRPNKEAGPGWTGWKRERVEERGMGNNFTWSNWLRFIIYDLGNNPLRDGKERETAGRGMARGGLRWRGNTGSGDGETGREGGDREREEGGKKYMRMKKKRTVGRTYPLIQDLFNYGPSPGLSRGRF